MYGIDFDDTLNFVDRSVKYSPNKELISFLKDKDFVIVTARGETPSNVIYLSEFCKEYGLAPIKTYFTNGGLKGDLLERLKVSVFIDDNSKQLKSCEDSGINQCIHPKDFHNIKTAKKKDPKGGQKKKAEKLRKKRACELSFFQNIAALPFKEASKTNQYKYKFKNELGNDIKVSVEETYDENKDKGLKFNAVKITMEGPNSLSENTVTYQEAEELRSVLTDFLEDSGIMKSTTEEVSK
jgi:hypothetical protein